MEIDDIDTIAVLGAGNMGHGIAEVAALAGYSVNLRDINEEFVQDGYEQIEWSLEKLAEKEQISDETAESALENVTPHVDIEKSVGVADFVIEAVPEKMQIKEEVYSDVEEHLPEHAIIASNTSSLSITDLSEQTDRPSKFCGMHFFNPPIRMQLVEVISGGHTTEETLEVTEALAEELDKTPVRVRKDSPGFVVNRILVPLMNEACWMVSEDAATIEEIDSTTKFDMGLPMGTFELGDQVGNDVTYHVLEYMNEVLGEAYEPAPFLEETIEAEHYGKKTGTGFYEYEDGDGVDIPSDAGHEKIENRLVAVMANEVGNLVGDDVADPDAIDEAVMLGAGFPDGPAKMADDAGLNELIKTLETLHDETVHPRFEVSTGLQESAKSGGFHDSNDDEGVEFTNIELRHPGDNIGEIVLAREARMNTINPELLDELDAAIDRFDEDDSVRAILVTGKGDRAFSAGADVTAMAGNAEPLDGVELSRKGQATFGKLEACDTPAIAGIDGFALGGGFELALSCDFRLASERSELGAPEHGLGLLPGWGGTQRLMRIAGFGRAKEIIFTADRYDPETMYEYDVLTEIVENDEFEERVHEFAAEIAAGPPIAQKFTKRAMLRGWENIDAGLELEAQAFGHLLNTDDLMEGITAFMGDEEPKFEGY